MTWIKLALRNRAKRAPQYLGLQRRRVRLLVRSAEERQYDHGQRRKSLLELVVVERRRKVVFVVDDDQHGRQTPVHNHAEEDQLEIPAFLRRQVR